LFGGKIDSNKRENITTRSK